MLSLAIHEKQLKVRTDFLSDSSFEAILSNELPMAIDFIRGAQAYLVTIFSAIIGIAVLYYLIGHACLIVVVLAPCKNICTFPFFFWIKFD